MVNENKKLHEIKISNINNKEVNYEKIKTNTLHMREN